MAGGTVFDRRVQAVEPPSRYIIAPPFTPKAKLLMLEQWRAGLRVSEALDLEVRDLSLDTATPTLRVRSGKGGKTRLVPVHPELHGALTSALAYGDISQGRLIEAHVTTAWRWVKTAVKRAEELGAIAPGKQVSTHTLRHSYARHLLMNGDTHQLPVTLAGAQLDSDDADLPGACARPDGEFGDGAVTCLPSTRMLFRCNAGPQKQPDSAQGMDRRFSSPNPCIRSTQVSEGNPTGAHGHQRPEIRRSTAILRG